MKDVNAKLTTAHSAAELNSRSALKPYISSISNPKLQNAVIRVENDLDALHIPYGDISSIEINPRYTRRFGSATRSWHPKRFGKEGSQMNPSFRIEVSNDFFQPGVPEQGLYENLLHEYLHTIPGCLNHGYKWQSYASLLNRKLHTHISTTTTPSDLGLEEVEENKAAYILECTSCHKRITRSRICSMVVFPSEYRCRCGGTFKLVKGEIPEKFKLDDSLIPDRKYAVECDHCHQKIYRERLSRLVQHPENYVCRCGGHFHRIR